MTSLAPQKTKRFWWWNSHISTKNSKWLQENLSDMDKKVNQMFKLLEEDADSFARRAEMYYKKRPELLKLVEEFYKAYRALAERYDNATGALRQAQKAMAEAFPNQIPSTAGDDFLSPSGVDSRTPEALQTYSISGSDISPKGSSGGRVRKGLVFEDMDHIGTHNVVAEMKISASESELARVEAEKEAAVLKCKEMMEKISSLEEERNKSKDFDKNVEEMKSSLTKLENERECFEVKCQNYETKISELEKYLSLLQNDTANFVVEASSLKEEMMKMGAEQDDFPPPSASESQIPEVFPMYSVSGTDDTQKGSSVRIATKGLAFDEVDNNGTLNVEAETNISATESDFARVEAEKEAVTLKCKEMMKKISSLEEERNKSQDFDQKMEEMKSTVTKLEKERECFVVKCQNYESKISELEKYLSLLQNDTANFVVEASSLKEELVKMGAEKDDIARDHQQLILSFSEAEAKLLQANDNTMRTEKEFEVVSKNFLEEKQMLRREISEITCKKNAAEEKHIQSESLIQSLKSELTAKSHEMKNLLTSLEEEHLRYVDAETAFQTLQQINSQCQKELLSVSTEIQKQRRTIEDIELHNQQLQIELSKVMSERNSLKELHLSSVAEVEGLRVQNNMLNDAIKKLEGELHLRIDEKMALQQETHSLKEELHKVKETHLVVVRGMESFGFSTDSFQSRVKNLMQDCERGKVEQDALMERISVLEKIAQEKQLLENSFSDMCAERETMKNKIERLEESYESLLGDKSALEDRKDQLESQLLAWKIELESVTKNNRSLEESRLESLSTIESLGLKLAKLGDSCSELEDEKANLVLVKENLALELSERQMQLELLKAQYEELLKEKESLLNEVDQLKASYCTEVEEHENLKIKSKTAENSFFTLENEKSNLQSNYHGLIEQIESLGFHPVNLSSSVKDLLEENAQLKQTCDKGIVERSALLGLKSVLTEDKASLESQLVACNKKLENAMGKIRSLEILLSESCSKIEMLEKENLELAITKENLLSELGTSRMQLDTLKGEHEELEKEMDSVLSEVEKLNGCYSSEVRDHENLKIKSRNLEDSFFLLEKEKSELQSNHKSFVSQVESVGLKAENLASSLKGLIEENSKLRQYCDDGTVRRSALESRIDFLNGELESGIEKNRSLERSLTDSRFTIQMLETQLKDFEEMCSNLENEKQILVKEKVLLHNEAQELEARYSAETQEHQSLKIKSKSLEDSFASLKIEKSEIHNNYTSYVTQVVSVGFNPETLAISLKNLLEENSQLKQNCDDGNDQRSALKSQIDLLNGELEGSIEKNRSLEKSLTDSRNTIQMLETQLRNLEEMCSNLENAKLILETEKGSLHNEAQDMRARYSSKTQEHESLKIKSKSLEDSFASLEIEKSEIQNNYTSYVTQVESVGFKPETLATSLKNLLEENAQLKENCERGKGEISSLDSQLLLLRKELESFVSKNGSLETSLAESRASIETLEIKLRNFEDEIKCLTLLETNLEKNKDALEKENMSLVNEMETLKACYAIETKEHQTLKVKSKSLEHSLFSLETEKSELHSNYSSLAAQVESVGFKPETLSSSVKNVLDLNSQLKEICDRSNAEKLSLESQLLLIIQELETFTENHGGFEKHLSESLEMLEMKLRNLIVDCDTLNNEWAKQKESLGNELEELKDRYSVETQEHRDLKVKSKGLEHSLTSLESKKSELHTNYQSLVTQVESIGLKPESLSTSVRKLQEERQNYADERSALLEEKLALTNSCYDLHAELEHVKREANDLQESHRVAVSDLEDQLAGKCCQFETEAIILENAIETLIGESKENKRDLKLLQSILLSVVNAVDSKQWTESDLMRSETQTGAVVSSLIDDHLTAVIENSILVSFLQEMQELKRLLLASFSDLEEEWFADKTLCLVLKRIVNEVFVAWRESEFKGLQESAFLSAFYEGKFIELTNLEETEVSLTVPKDIVLDHVSETSSLGVRRNPSEDDDQMLKLWETTNHVSSSTQGAAKHSRGNQSMNSSELSVDKLEISKTFSGTLWDANKLLERLRSDEAKLSHLSAAVGDMKVRAADKAEHSSVREQLEESDAAIATLAERNRSLRKTVEENAAWFEESRTLNGDAGGDVAAVKRKRVRDEARRGSEKIGRLEMEVKKAEYILMKEKEKIVRGNTVPLRDYLYGKKRPPRLTVSKRFCFCLKK